MNAALSDVERARAIYTKRNLVFYDRWVHGFSNRRLWHCDTGHLLDLFRSHISANHLEIGAGTGTLLAETLPPPPLRLVLFDIQRPCLERAARQLSAHAPECVEGNVLEPLPPLGAPFDSISINYVLHCLPGRIEDKAARVCDHLARHLDQNGVLFGSTVLGKDVERPVLARLAMGFYNWRGIFNNREDSLGGLMEVLSQRFRTFHVEVRGCVVLFWARGLRAPDGGASSLDPSVATA